MFQTTFIEQGAGVCFVGSGIVTAGEIGRAKIALSECEETARRIRFAIVDLQEATQLPLNIDDLRRLAGFDMQLALLIPDAVVAVVAPKDYMFGIARMWEVLAEATGWKISVFRSSGEACKWVTQQCCVQ
jgi:hypothetical protein